MHEGDTEGDLVDGVGQVSSLQLQGLAGGQGQHLKAQVRDMVGECKHRSGREDAC